MSTSIKEFKPGFNIRKNTYKTKINCSQYITMYYDFIKTCVLKERKTILGTNLSDLIKVYQFCEILNKGN